MSAVEPLPADEATVVDVAGPAPGVDAIVVSVEARVVDVPRWQIERLVIEELTRFRDARVTAYVPILVERAVLRRLWPFRGVERGGAT